MLTCEVVAAVERPRRQAKKAQPYWMGNQAEGGASEGAPEEASRSPTAEDDTENGDPSFLPPAANDAYALPAIDETEAAPLPGEMRLSQTRRIPRLCQSRLDCLPREAGVMGITHQGSLMC